MTTLKTHILKLLRDDEGYSAHEIAEATGAGLSHVRSVAARNHINIPTLPERVRDLKKQRDRLLKELR